MDSFLPFDAVVVIVDDNARSHKQEDLLGLMERQTLSERAGSESSCPARRSPLQDSPHHDDRVEQNVGASRSIGQNTDRVEPNLRLRQDSIDERVSSRCLKTNFDDVANKGTNQHKKKHDDKEKTEAKNHPTTTTTTQDTARPILREDEKKAA